jgi:hypothetical protein
MYIVVETHQLAPLLDGATDIGDVVALSYRDAKIVTGQAEWLVGGVVRGGWLVAAAVGHEKTLPVLLLRVGEADAQVRAHKFNERADMANFVQTWRSYDAEVMGAFYVQKNDQATFASELDSVAPPQLYRLYQPSTQGISFIASFTRSSVQSKFHLGVVRFSSARSVDQRYGRDQASVDINVEDFLSKRSAFLAATRGGKSNAIKTLTASVVKHAADHNFKVGQIIFDPQGEYASTNAQDGTALRLVGDEEQVRVYRTKVGTGLTADPKERRLLLNFYQTDVIKVAWGLITTALEEDKSEHARGVRALSMDEPDRDEALVAWGNWSKGRVAFYGMLAKSGFEGRFPRPEGIPVAMTKAGADHFNTSIMQKGQPHLCVAPAEGDETTWFVPTPQSAAAVMDWVADQSARRYRAENGDADGKPIFGSGRVLDELELLLGDASERWDNPSLNFQPIASYMKAASESGAGAIVEMRQMHDPESDTDITAAIWEDMIEGRLVIIDLSIGTDWVVRVMSERIANAIVSAANHRFRTGQDPVPVQIIVEEAHNLFKKGRESTRDPWVRIAKEGAKYAMGLVYATQEVTSVDPRVLSNTHNWLIGHLNSGNETGELSKYYEYAKFADSLRRADEVGYIRLKMASSPYTVPTQVRMFDHELVNDCRIAQGLDPI